MSTCRFLFVLLVLPACLEAGTIDMLQGQWRHEKDPKSTFEIQGFKMIFSSLAEPNQFDTLDLQHLTGEIAGVHTREMEGSSERETLMLISDTDTSFWSIVAVGLESFSVLDLHARTTTFERVQDGMLISPYQFVYHGGKDTLDFYGFLHRSGKEFGLPASTRIIDRLQIDGRGPEEIIFKLYRNFWESRHGGTFDITENGSSETYMIWNLATGECIWHCNSSYFFSCRNFEAYAMPPRRNGQCNYSYDVKFGASGDIMISQLQQEHKIVNPDTGEQVSRIGCEPDKLPGIYRFENGNYRIVN